MIALLSSIPFVSNLLGFFTSKKRLLIEYMLIAVLLAVAGFTFNLWLNKAKVESKLEAAKKEVKVIQSKLLAIELVNDVQEKTIEDLRDLRITDAKALTGLLQDYKLLAKRDTEARQRLSALENTNETVRAYLNTPIPAELECLLNNSCRTGSEGGDGD